MYGRYNERRSGMVKECYKDFYKYNAATDGRRIDGIINYELVFV
jgi:hypothetical protein